MKIKLGRFLVGLSVTLTAVVSTLVDILPASGAEEGHMANVAWAPHALFHNAAMFCTLLAMMLIFLWLMLRTSREPDVGLRAAALFPVGFWLGFYYITTIFPQTSLMNFMVRDATGKFVPLNMNNVGQWPEPAVSATPFVMGVPIYINVTIGTILILIAAVGYWIYQRGVQAGERDPKQLP